MSLMEQGKARFEREKGLRLTIMRTKSRLERGLRNPRPLYTLKATHGNARADHHANVDVRAQPTANPTS